MAKLYCYIINEVWGRTLEEMQLDSAVNVRIDFSLVIVLLHKTQHNSAFINFIKIVKSL
jgi:hypothetical protein